MINGGGNLLGDTINRSNTEQYERITNMDKREWHRQLHVTGNANRQSGKEGIYGMLASIGLGIQCRNQEVILQLYRTLVF